MAQAQTSSTLTAEQVALLQTHVDEILKSSQFRNSKRYPRFLRKVVTCTITGDVEELKERILGCTVFDRMADYDTSADPIVRITAGEIRKRLAHFYQENGSASQIRITLPVGGYIPEFHFGPSLSESVVEEPPSTATSVQPLHDPPADAPTAHNSHDETALPPTVEGRTGHRSLLWFVGLASSFVTLLLAGTVYAMYQNHLHAKSRSLNAFWEPMMAEAKPAPFIIGRSTLVLPLDSDPSLEASLLGIRSKIALSDALAFSKVCSLIRTETRDCTLQLSNQATISDLRRGPVVVIGLFNNEWSSRLLAPLRFRANHTVDANGITHEAWITDSKDSRAHWGLDVGQRMDSVTKDYGVLARFDSAVTGRPVFVIGGLSSLGTEGVGELATDPKAMDLLEGSVPKGKSFQNVEAVIETEVINGKPGQSHVIAADFW